MQLYPLQGKYKDKISNSQDQEIPSELILKIKEDFIKNGGNKDVLEEQYSADLVHRVLGSVKNSAEVEEVNNANGKCDHCGKPLNGEGYLQQDDTVDCAECSKLGDPAWRDYSKKKTANTNFEGIENAKKHELKVGDSVKHVKSGKTGIVIADNMHNYLMKVKFEGDKGDLGRDAWYDPKDLKKNSADLKNEESDEPSYAQVLAYAKKLIVLVSSEKDAVEHMKKNFSHIVDLATIKKAIAEASKTRNVKKNSRTKLNRQLLVHYMQKTSSPLEAAKLIARSYSDITLDDAMDAIQEEFDPEDWHVKNASVPDKQLTRAEYDKIVRSAYAKRDKK